MVKLRELQEVYDINCKSVLSTAELDITDSVEAKVSWNHSWEEGELANIVSGSITTKRDSVYNAACNISSDKKIQVQYGDAFPPNGSREVSVQANLGRLVGNFRSVWGNPDEDEDSRSSEDVNSDARKHEEKGTRKIEGRATYYQPVSKATSISGTIGLNERPLLSLEHSFTEDRKNGIRLNHEITTKGVDIAIKMKSPDKHHSLKAELSAAQHALSTKMITYKLKAFDGFKAKATINVDEGAYEYIFGWTSSTGGEFTAEISQPFSKEDERSIAVMKKWVF